MHEHKFESYFTKHCLKILKAYDKVDFLTVSMAVSVTGMTPKTCRKWLEYLVFVGMLRMYKQQYRPNIISRVYVKANHNVGKS